jgi:hypothetical protein
LEAEGAVEGERDFAALEEHGAPYFLDGEAAALLLAVGPYDAVRAVVTVGVEDAALIGAHHGGVGEVPEEAAGRERLAPHLLAVVFESRAVAAVVQAVQKLGGKYHVLAVQVSAAAVVVVDVVLGIGAPKYLPGVHHGAFYRSRRSSTGSRSKLWPLSLPFIQPMMLG